MSKSYRPRTGCRGRRGQRRDPLGKVIGRTDQRLPEPLAVGAIEGGEDLAAARVEQGQPGARRARLGQAQADRVERADAAHRQPKTGGKATRGGDPDPQANEGAGAEADGESLDPLPTAGSLSGCLYRAQQGGRVLGLAVGARPQQRLVQDVAVAPGADGGVDRGGVEANDGQGGVASSR